MLITECSCLYTLLQTCPDQRGLAKAINPPMPHAGAGIDLQDELCAGPLGLWVPCLAAAPFFGARFHLLCAIRCHNGALHIPPGLCTSHLGSAHPTRALHIPPEFCTSHLGFCASHPGSVTTLGFITPRWVLSPPWGSAHPTRGCPSSDFPLSDTKQRCPTAGLTKLTLKSPMPSAHQQQQPGARQRSPCSLH